MLQLQQFVDVCDSGFRRGTRVGVFLVLALLAALCGSLEGR